jgi:hypothetical protein
MSEEQLMRALEESKKDHSQVQAEGNIDKVIQREDSAYDQEIKWDENAVPGSDDASLDASSDAQTENQVQVENVAETEIQQVQPDFPLVPETQVEVQPKLAPIQQSEDKLMFNLQDVRDHNAQVEAAQQPKTKEKAVPQFNDEMGLHIRG